MRVNVVHPNHKLDQMGECCLVLPVFAGAKAAASAVMHPEDAQAIERLLAAQVITGKPGDCYSIHTPNRMYTEILALGMGKREAFSGEALRRGAGSASGELSKRRKTAVILDASGESGWPIECFLEGLMLGQYRFERYKAKKADTPEPSNIEQITFVIPSEYSVKESVACCARAALVCDAVNWARDLGNTAPNDLTPIRLAEIAQEMARESGLGFECLDERQMAELGMGALLGVAKGSAETPRLIFLRYEHPEATETIGLAGKGVTFDTGGISIKGSDGMQDMKYDMCGAAAVLGAMKALAALKPKRNIVAAVPAVENMLGGKAQHPGDVVRAYNGKTIEVQNTDAEGRMILADAIAYLVERHKPVRLADIATLTGGCITALGHHAIGLMSNNDAEAACAIACGEAVGERLWRLPLWEDYNELMQSDYVDICIVGASREASAIVGGCFIQQFVSGTPWIHLDIAGTAFDVKHLPYLNPKYATGSGVRLLVQWACSPGV